MPSENEKLRALLAEARRVVGDEVCIDCGVGSQMLWGRIDAALAEPVEADQALTVREACRRRMPLDGVDAQALEGALALTERERDKARAALSALCAEFEGAVAHADWKANGSKGMQVPFTGDFASVTQLPSAIGRMRWWAREIRKVLEDKP